MTTLVLQWPLVAKVIITAAKEEVGRSSIESNKVHIEMKLKTVGWV